MVEVGKRDKNKDQEKLVIQEKIRKEKKRILELEMQIQFLKTEKQNVKKLLDAIQKIKTVKNNH